MSKPEHHSQQALDRAVSEFLAAGTAAAPAPAANGPRADRARPDLHSAFEQVLEHEEAKRRIVLEQVPLWRTLVLPLTLLMLLGGTAYVWLGKPAWLYPPVVAPRAPQTQLMAMAYLRNAAVVITEFHRRTGRLPVSLTEARFDLPGVGYSNRDGRFRLTVIVRGRVFRLEAAPGDTAFVDQGVE